MARMYKLCTCICLLLCTIHTVHSTLIRATLSARFSRDENELYVSNNIDAKYLNNKPGDVLTLHQLMDESELPALTLATGRRLVELKIGSISLRSVPVFRNVFSLETIEIDGNKIKTLPTNGFNVPNPTYLHLYNNEIENIQNGAFNRGLVVLLLRCNKLRRFSHTWFQSPEKIDTLSLAGNQIQHLQRSAFVHMTGLRDLFLWHNGITRIDSAAFGPGLQNLVLSYNNISQLTASMFSSGYAEVEFLHVEYNQLNYLSTQLLQSFRLRFISIDGNPWQCPCLWDVEKWIRTHNVTREYAEISNGEPVCAVDITSIDVCLPKVNSELQQIYASALSPLYDCYATSCGVCESYHRKYRQIN